MDGVLWQSVGLFHPVNKAAHLALSMLFEKIPFLSPQHNPDQSTAEYIVAVGPFMDLRMPLGLTPAALTVQQTKQQAQPPVVEAPVPAPNPGSAAIAMPDSYRSFCQTRKRLLNDQSQKRLRSTTVDFRRVWWDRQIRARNPDGISIWRPVPPQGYVSLGMCCVLTNYLKFTS